MAFELELRRIAPRPKPGATKSKARASHLGRESPELHLHDVRLGCQLLLFGLSLLLGQRQAGLERALSCVSRRQSLEPPLGILQ